SHSVTMPRPVLNWYDLCRCRGWFPNEGLLMLRQEVEIELETEAVPARQCQFPGQPVLLLLPAPAEVCDVKCEIWAWVVDYTSRRAQVLRQRQQVLMRQVCPCKNQLFLKPGESD